MLTERPALQAKLTAAHRQDQQKSVFSVKLERIERTVVKLARSHSLYELNEPQPSVPASVTIATTFIR